MFIVSRQIGQSVVIAERVVVTVAVVNQEFVDLGLSDLSGRRLSVLTLPTGQLTSVIHGVRGTFIGMIGRRVQLGFEHSPEVNITRLEYFPKNDSCNVP